MRGVAYSVGERVLFMKLHEQGRSLKTLSRETGVPRQILSGWWKRYRQAGVEGLRPHYAMTLRHWVERLERNHARALQFVNEATYRVWRLYMAACALEFESGRVGIYQILAAKRAAGNLPLPLTRRRLYV